MSLSDERYGDIWFEEEDPTSDLYNPKCCRNVYMDLVNGVFDYDFDDDENYADYDTDYDYDPYDELAGKFYDDGF